LSRKFDWQGEGDIAIVLSGRNVDPDDFQNWTSNVS